MDRNALDKHVLRSLTNAVLQEVESLMKEQRPDTSSTAEEHKVGFEAGFRACKRAFLDALAD